MSIVKCEDCDRNLDIDYGEAVDLFEDGSIWMCDYCYGEYKQLKNFSYIKQEKK